MLTPGAHARAASCQDILGHPTGYQVIWQSGYPDSQAV